MHVATTGPTLTPLLHRRSVSLDPVQLYPSAQHCEIHTSAACVPRYLPTRCPVPSTRCPVLLTRSPVVRGDPLLLQHQAAVGGCAALRCCTALDRCRGVFGHKDLTELRMLDCEFTCPN
eukprot:12391-Rhodomonas_salina.1